MEDLLFGLFLLVLLVIFYWGMPDCYKEGFNQNFKQSMLMKDMDYVKDRSGYTVDDYVLTNYVLTGQPISNPY